MSKKKNEYNKVKVKEMEVVEKDGTEEVEVVKKEKIVKGKVSKKKRGVIERLVIGFIGPDGIQRVGHSINQDIIIPAIKNIIVDSITTGINSIMFPDGSGPRSSTTGNARTYHNAYRGAQKSYGNSYRARNEVPQSRARKVVEEYIFEDRNEALDVLDGLRDIIAQYGQTSVADYYDLIGVDGDYTDNNYGWDTLDTARVVGVRGGFVLRLPQVEVLP